MTRTVPRNLPTLTADAVRARWDVQIEHDHHYRGIAVTRAQLLRGLDEVYLVWDDAGRLITSEINDVQTPYTQCAALLRSPEGATP